MTNNVAETILSQLGGNRFLAITGAHSLTAEKNSLTFKLPKLSKVWAVKITLDPSDTYTVQAYNRARAPLYFKPLDPVSDVYADSLRRVFTELSGLDCTL